MRLICSRRQGGGCLASVREPEKISVVRTYQWIIDIASVLWCKAIDGDEWMGGIIAGKKWNLWRLWRETMATLASSDRFGKSRAYSIARVSSAISSLARLEPMVRVFNVFTVVLERLTGQIGCRIKIVEIVTHPAGPGKPRSRGQARRRAAARPP